MPDIDFQDPVAAAHEIAARIRSTASTLRQRAGDEFSSMHGPGDVASLFNRGLIAGTLGAPVDMMSGALRSMRDAPASAASMGTPTGVLSQLGGAGLRALDRAGVHIPENATGGSERIGNLMERAGLTSPVRRPVLETAAGLAPVLPSAAMGAGRGLLRAGEAAMMDAMPGSARAQRGAVKLPGGNWAKAGSGADTVDNALSPVKKWEPDAFPDDPSVHINKWIDKKLAPYVKNQLGTENDPLLKMADTGALHFDPTERLDGGIGASVSARKSRSEAGFPMTNSGTTPAGQAWSDLSDQAIRTRKAADLQAMPQHMTANPWLSKVDPGSPVHHANSSPFEDLGFGHLTDELHNAILPDNPTGLPQQLRWKPEDLTKVTVPQAVQRVADINAWRVKNASKANLDLQGEFPVHKAYDDGMKWVELNHPTDPAKTASMLKQEGSAMGHCVGGYCDDVTSGNSRIFSLRDADGQPHVTVETNPAERIRGYSDDIQQIKGKGNKAPADKYLPYVQDFVKGGDWGRVGDLGNTGLIDRTERNSSLLGIDPTWNSGVGSILDKAMFKTGDSAPRFMTPDEFRSHAVSVDPTLAPPQAAPDLSAPPAFKRGGRVTFEDPVTAMQMIRMGNP